MELPFLRVADHSYPLFLLGSDVMRSFSSSDAMSYAGISISRAEGQPKGELRFEQGKDVHRVPLVWVPSDS